MSYDLSTVAAVHDASSAEFYESLLERSGIRAYVPAKYTAALQHPWFWVTLGELGVQVLPEDEGRAREVLLELLEQEEPERAPAREVPIEMPLVIPEGISKRYAYLLYGLLSILPSMVVFFFLHGSTLNLLLGFGFYLVCLFFLWRTVSIYIDIRRRHHATLQSFAAAEETEPAEAVSIEDVDESAGDYSGLISLAYLAGFAVVLAVVAWLYAFLQSLAGID